MEFVDQLRVRGVRVTHPRQLVWNVLSERHEHGHLSAAEIAAQVRARDPGINQSSVYRTLSLFAELDLVRESRTGDGSATTWEIRHPDGLIHLLCDACGTVLHHRTELVERLRRDVERTAGFVPDTVDVRVTGHCAQCAENRTGSTTGPAGG